MASSNGQQPLAELPPEPRDDVDRVASLLDCYARLVEVVATFPERLIKAKFVGSFGEAYPTESAAIFELRRGFRSTGRDRVALIAALEAHNLVGPSLRLKLRVAGDVLELTLPEPVEVPGPQATLGYLIGVQFDWANAYFQVQQAKNSPFYLAKDRVHEPPWWRRLGRLVRRFVDKADPAIDSALNCVPVIGGMAKEFKDELLRLTDRSRLECHDVVLGWHDGDQAPWLAQHEDVMGGNSRIRTTR